MLLHVTKSFDADQWVAVLGSTRVGWLQRERRGASEFDASLHCSGAHDKPQRRRLARTIADEGSRSE